MASEVTRVPYEAFTRDVAGFIDRVRGGEELVVEDEAGEVAVVKPVRRRPPQRRSRTKPERIAAALAAAGAWRDLDANAMLDELDRRDEEVPPTPLLAETALIASSAAISVSS